MNEISWLPRSVRKGLPVPKVVFDEDNDRNCCGYYTCGSGVITIVLAEDNKMLPSIIAHEYRHFMQDLHGQMENIKPIKFAFGDNYDNDIKQFYLRQPWEMDALLFEWKHAKTYLNDWWLNKLVLGK